MVNYFTLLNLAAFALLLSGCSKPLQQVPSGESLESIIVPGDPQLVSKRVAACADGSRFRALPIGHPLFPDLSQIRAWADRNPDARRYADGPHNVYLEAKEDVYWKSEYVSEGRPVEFRTNFLVHIAGENGASRITVYEYLPEVRMGMRFGLTQHGPGRMWDQRWVAPTNRDKTELIRSIVSCRP